MKKIATGIILIFAFSAGVSAPDTQAKLTLTVTGLKAGRGNLMVVIFNSRKSYSGKWENAVKTRKTKVKGKSMVLVFENLKKGTWYGIKCFQDLNNNNKLDTGLFGIPKEPFGFSQNPQIRFGAPKWHHVKFMLKDINNEKLIKLKSF